MRYLWTLTHHSHIFYMHSTLRHGRCREGRVRAAAL
jgi:hypothetical protein